MRLPDFISANVEPILVEWESFARELWPGAATDPATLRDHAEQMLHAAVTDMRSSQSDEQQSDKSKGNGRDGLDADGLKQASAATALTVERQLTVANDRVEADPARLQQTLWNLLKNSAKFTSSGGRVFVRTRNEADRLVIEVADNGLRATVREKGRCSRFP